MRQAQAPQTQFVQQPQFVQAQARWVAKNGWQVLVDGQTALARVNKKGQWQFSEDGAWHNLPASLTEVVSIGPTPVSVVGQEWQRITSTAERSADGRTFRFRSNGRIITVH